MHEDNFEKFGLVIIESLSDDDEQTGSLLHDETIKYKKFAEPNLSSFFYKVETKKELFETLTEIIEKVKTRELFPILQIETHGSDDGIMLASGENVLWNELMDKFREINILLLNSLVIMMSMCVGISVISYIDPSKRAPFRAIIGSTREIDELELLFGFEAFYNNYFFSFDLKESLGLMNNEIDTKNPTFHLLSAESCFDGIVDPDRDPKHFSETVNKYSNIEKETNYNMKDKSMEEIQDIVDKKLRKILAEIKETKDHFLMTDLKKN